MTLSHPKVLSLLENDFECGWKDITGESYAGTSGEHLPTFHAVTTSNCAGHHNVQMVFMTSAGRIVHCLPGFWEPRALLSEVKLAKKLVKVHESKKLTLAKKNAKFLDLHLEHALEHDARTRHASHLQGFDRSIMRNRQGSDFKRKGFGVKTTDQVVHERMAERPFLTMASFDLPTFIDMGKKGFDAHGDGCNGDHGPGSQTTAIATQGVQVGQAKPSSQATQAKGYVSPSPRK